MRRVPESIPVTTILSQDPIRTALRAQLTSGRFDLLVMGTRDGGGMRRLRRSTCTFALRRLGVPMLLVRAEPEDEPQAAAAPRPPSATAPAAV